MEGNKGNWRHRNVEERKIKVKGWKQQREEGKQMRRVELIDDKEMGERRIYRKGRENLKTKPREKGKQKKCRYSYTENITT